MTLGNSRLVISLVFAFSAITHCGCQESSPLDSESPARRSDANSLIDRDIAKEVPLVLRVEMAEFHGGSKYHWATVNILEILKNTTNDLFTDKMKVAMYGFGKGIPNGKSIIYLVRCNDEHPEYGWKLYEPLDEIKEEMEKMERMGTLSVQKSHPNQ